VFLAGCDGPQSALVTAGYGAERIAELFWWMLGGALIIWLLVVGTAVYAIRGHNHRFTSRHAYFLIVGGGAVFPTVVLGGLLIYALQLFAHLRDPADAGDFRVEVSGEQWWWRVRYVGPGGEKIELANEVRLPVNTVAELRLYSSDVIHSFWIPSLGGKMDMIPGRETRLLLQPTRTGTFRGVCAEYCGGSHALMAFPVVVMQPGEFAAWLQHQGTQAAQPEEEITRRGQHLFLANGCGSCHRIRGTAADGELGPDLTHVGSRLSLGADTLPNNVNAFARWIAHTEQVKPQVRMPSFGMLPQADVRAMALYLESLQ